ncbi:MAG: hypothetical protein JWP22_802 [Ramlibacter sp.]|nr:hypothetical protein [Ramlibacter sp.]
MLYRLALPLLLALLPVGGHALCTSEGAARPAALLERFISADCPDCWRDPKTPAAAGDTLALDWILPGRMGEDAPLSSVALAEGVERLDALGRGVPQRSDAVTSRRTGQAPPLRLAQGDAFNDYIAASMELKKPGRASWRPWLLLVERLPAGTEGSPVARNLVRNVFRPDWDQARRRGPGGLADLRALQIHAGARAERLRLVGVLQDARGRIRAIGQTECSG